MNKRKKMLLKVTVAILQELSQCDIINDRINHLLKYDGADQDISCLADDIEIEFDI